MEMETLLYVHIFVHILFWFVAGIFIGMVINN
jgi:hypothetical protein